MTYLLDVNALVAWGWTDHLDHTRVDSWVAAILKDGSDMLMTSAIPQLGFVRVSVQRGAGSITPELASRVLAGMIQHLGPLHQFLADDQTSDVWPSWCQGAARTTDAHLLRLAKAH